MLEARALRSQELLALKVLHERSIAHVVLEARNSIQFIKTPLKRLLKINKQKNVLTVCLTGNNRVYNLKTHENPLQPPQSRKFGRHHG